MSADEEAVVKGIIITTKVDLSAREARALFSKKGLYVDAVDVPGGSIVTLSIRLSDTTCEKIEGIAYDEITDAKKRIDEMVSRYKEVREFLDVVRTVEQEGAEAEAKGLEM